MKQYINIQRFWCTTENPVRIQIHAAIASYCLAAIIHHDLKPKCSIYEILQILNMSLTDTSSISNLLNQSNDKIDNKLHGSSEPNLFNFLKCLKYLEDTH